MNDTWWRGENQLSPEQAPIIDLPAERSYLVYGPAGSGKTNLLVLRAKYLYAAGFTNLRVIVFNRALEEFLSAGADGYDFPTDRITTSTRWAIETLREHGVSIEGMPSDFDERRVFLLAQLRRLATEKNVDGMLDAILLDEAQDYLPGEIDIFHQYANNLFAVADSRQKIYSQNDCLPTIEAAVDEIKTLQFHYRNGRRICRFADLLTKVGSGHESLLHSSNYNENANPSSVDFLLCRGVAMEAEMIINRLITQVKAYPGEMIGVLCPKNEDVAAIWSAISVSSISSMAALLGDSNRGAKVSDAVIWVSSMHGFKGLEARAVHVAGLDKLIRFENQRNLMYMAATRAKTSLSLYASGVVPIFLDSAIKSMSPKPATLPNRSVAFGGKK